MQCAQHLGAIRDPQRALGGRKQPQLSPCKASSGGFGDISRAESDGDDETGPRARRRRFSGGVRWGEAPPGRR
eukprot:10084579-Alexandrium_andersonii.AAC.1